MTVFKTPNGTELELIKLKGKDYMLVAQRLIWFTEVTKCYSIDSQFLHIDDDQTVCRTTVTIYNEATKEVVRQVSATKRETKKDFPDHTEKAETGSLGRALAMLSFGTAQALADFDEITNSDGKVVTRLADAPLSGISKVSEVTKSEPVEKELPKTGGGGGFKKTTKVVDTATKAASTDTDWQ